MNSFVEMTTLVGVTIAALNVSLVLSWAVMSLLLGPMRKAGK